MTDRRRNLGDVMGDRRLSNEVAIVSVDPDEGVREWRCREIEAGTLACAALLRRRGIGPGSTVGLFSKNSAHNPMAYQGIMRTSRKAPVSETIVKQSLEMMPNGRARSS